MSKRIRHNSLRLFSAALTIGALFFGVRYINRLWESYTQSGSSVDSVYIALSFILFGLFYFLLSKHWQRVCQDVSPSTSKKQWLAFFASQPYKYLPSSLFTFSFRAKFANDLGVNVRKSSAAQLMENINLLSSGASVAGLFYLMSINSLALIPFSLLVILISVITPKKINLSFRNKILSLDKWRGLTNWSIAFIAWVISGFSFFLVNKALGLDLNIFIAIASNSLAYILGILAFFAPGGIGVRESVFSAFKVSESSIIVWRIMTFLFDMVFGVVAIFLIKSQLNRKVQNSVKE